MHRIKFLFAVTTCSFGLLFLVGVVNAGSLFPSVSPAAAGYTLSDIYTRLTTNAVAVSGDHDFSPSASPAESHYTLTQIYGAIPTIDASKVLFGTTYLGVDGTMPDNEGDTASTTQAAVGGVNYFTAAEGYYDGDDRVSATDAEIAALDASIAEGNIRSGISIFSVAGGFENGYPGSGWTPNGAGDGSTALTQAACDAASGWYWFEDANGDGDTTDSEDGICVQGTHQAAAGSWNGDESTSERDNTYIAAYTCTGNFPTGSVATYSGSGSGVADTVWNDGDCALCQADCYDGKKDLPDQGGYTSPMEDIVGHNGPITPEVLKNWKGTRLPTADDFFGFCGYKDGYIAGDNYSTSCSSDTTYGNYGGMIGRTGECLDLSNSGAWEWLSEQRSNLYARGAGYNACSGFGNAYVDTDYRFRAVFRP